MAAQALADGLACLFSRSMSGLARACCDLADDGWPNLNGTVSPREEAAGAASGSPLGGNPAGMAVVKIPSALPGSAVLADAAVDAVPVIAGMRR